MSKDEIKIISKEDYQNEELSQQNIIFDNTIFEQIKGKELDLSVEKVLEIPTLRNWFKRQKEEYYVVASSAYSLLKEKPSIYAIFLHIRPTEMADTNFKLGLY